MRIAIYGVGAIGGHLAVRLADAGHDVSVVARGETLRVIRDEGLRLQAGDATVHVHPRATDRCATLGPQDVVFVCVKATALANIVAPLQELVGPGTSVVFAQNGMPWWYPIGLATTGDGSLPALSNFRLADDFLRFLDPAQVVPGVVYSANEVLSPGVVRNNTPTRNRLEIAALMPSAASSVERLRAALVGASIESPDVADIRAAVWLKLIANVSSSSLAITTGHPAAVALDPAIQQTFRRIAAECLAVARHHGYELEAKLDLDRWTVRPPQHTPSMLQDYQQGRTMEIAEIVLAPLAFARSAGIATPTLDAVAAIATRLAIDRGLYRP